ncbi:hypothetical protein ES703_41490 [subsurface metagenome]
MAVQERPDEVAGDPAQGELELGVLKGGVVSRLVDGRGDGPVPAAFLQADLVVTNNPLVAVAGAGRGYRALERCGEGLCECDPRDSGNSGRQLWPPISFYELYKDPGRPAQ